MEFTNGVIIYAGDVVGAVNEDHIRRIQIRETIITHLEREQELFYQGIKVLSLFLSMKLQNINNMMIVVMPITVNMRIF